MALIPAKGLAAFEVLIGHAIGRRKLWHGLRPSASGLVPAGIFRLHLTISDPLLDVRGPKVPVRAQPEAGDFAYFSTRRTVA